VEEEVLHFQKIYKEPPREKIKEIIKMISSFPMFMDHEQNEEVGVEVTKKEHIAIIKYFEKSRSLNLDCWIIEFFLEFYELMKEDILRVAWEPIIIVKVLRNI